MADQGIPRVNTIIACAITVGQELLRNILNNLYLESSDDEADRIIEEANLVEAKLRFGSRGHCEVKEQLYVNEIIPKFSNEVFRQHFRMTKTTYETLERWLTPTLTRIGKKGRPMIPVRNQLLSVIRLLTTPDSFRSFQYEKIHSTQLFLQSCECSK